MGKKEVKNIKITTLITIRDTMEHELNMFRSIEKTTESINEGMKTYFFGKPCLQNPEPLPSSRMLEHTKKKIAELVDALDDFYQSEWAENPRDGGSKAAACKTDGCRGTCKDC